ncbi:unnamed protein product [Darwinula stevensoni]|uniref:C1q domain-containing protein n=1 Tax=Darwinula stevensoni TaxID=69355 RepID=A0A7R8X9S9_9CRUS|nr:unnamed protein product [Darwinula stevensoni]CAG0891374.1 unnamed protein product [Darwinula stevensoni]
MNNFAKLWNNRGQNCEEIPVKSIPEPGKAPDLEEILSNILGKMEELAKDNTELKRSNARLNVENVNIRSHLNVMEERVQYLEAVTRQITPPTCGSLADLGITRTGTYLVDPDGVLRGDPPIQYDCLSTALKAGETQNARWVDRHGDPQYYWDGAHAEKHMCRCGLTDECVDPTLPCNCDAEAPQWESDSGAITNRTALPITELRFGGLRLDFQQARHTLGALVCKGHNPLDRPTRSCSSLRQAGHTRTGYYLINTREGRLDVALCQMDLDETDPKFQLETGARIAVENVYFDAYLVNYQTNSGRIRFDGTEVNIGDAMSPSTGIFTAPTPGIYAFHLHYFSDIETQVNLRQNGIVKGQAYADDVYGYDDGQTPGQSILLTLDAGDQVDAYLDFGSAGSTSDRNVHFVGYLLYPL